MPTVKSRSLAEARRRAGNERWPKLLRTDYRELPFADQSFDAALNLFTSLGYLGDEQDAKVLAEIRRVLRPGCRLVIETMHRDLLVRQFRDHDWRSLGEGRPARRAADVRPQRGRRSDDPNPDRRRR